MSVNKVTYAGNTLIDLTGDTVTSDKLLEGVQAHKADGTIITGTIKSDQVIFSLETEHYVYQSLDDFNNYTIEDSYGTIIQGKNVYRLM